MYYTAKAQGIQIVYDTFYIWEDKGKIEKRIKIKITKVVKSQLNGKYKKKNLDLSIKTGLQNYITIAIINKETKKTDYKIIKRD